MSLIRPAVSFGATDSFWLDRTSNTLFQWGRRNSTTDGSEAFTFGTAFNSATGVMVMTGRIGANLEFILAVEDSVSATGFSINRDDTIDNPVPFFFIALGPAVPL